MDSFEAAKVVHDRIMKLEPENIARKIIGYIFLQNLPDQEMIRLALGPDTLIQNLIHETKSTFFMGSAPVISPPISPTVNPSPLSDASFQFNRFSPPSPHPFLPPAAFQRVRKRYPQLVATEEFGLQHQFMGLKDHLEPVGTCLTNEYFSTEAGFNSLGIRGSRNSLNLMDYPVKLCHYFKKGYCKHAESCRYLHVGSNPESYTNVFDPHSYDVNGEDQLLSPGSLDKLELEITELLKSRRGNPVSIAALPMLYYEKYGRTLQAEGYLTESQRHGKAGFSLTKLLARLNNSIRLIDRPHGQHFLILAEDAPKYMEIRGERNDPGPIVSGSRQIYLTFPADSTFTEEDVSNYFRTFGPVQDVRIPCQQTRMFGFVTFENADTVKLILSKGNPHYVCGARVLVKPYRGKSKLLERKYQDKFDHQMFYHSQPADMDLHARWGSRLRRKLMEEREQALELETMRLSQLQLARDPFSSQSCLGYSTNELKLLKDNPKFSSAERYNYMFDVLNHGSTSDDNPKYPVNSCGDQESAQGLNLPDSPFASAVASSISAII